MHQDSNEGISKQVGVACGRISREDHGRAVWTFLKACQQVPTSEFPAVLCQHVLIASRAASAAVFIEPNFGSDAICVATRGHARMNGEAVPLIREAVRTLEARFFGPARFPLFEMAGEAIAGACVPFVSACEGRTFVIKLERRPGELAFTDGEQNMLRTLALAASFHVPPADSGRIVPPAVSLRLTTHDPEARRTRHGLRFLHAKIVGESPSLIAALHRLEKALMSPKHLLILGETGSGKEEMARALAEEGYSKGWRFVKVNAAALASNLVDSELFGYVKGAFTGALKDKVGLVGGGGKFVLFIDEIAELALDVQVKLFQLAETGEFRPVGAKEVQRAEVRLVAATSGDLERLMAAGTFKIDFYSRFAGKVVRVPALRDRLDDLPRLLVAFFGEDSERFGPEARASIAAYAWPLNVREFRDVLEDVLNHNPGMIRAQHVLDEIAFRPRVPLPVVGVEYPSLACLKGLSDAEKLRVILAELKRNGGDRAAIRRASGYSDEGWARLEIRLELHPGRAKLG